MRIIAHSIRFGMLLRGLPLILFLLLSGTAITAGAEELIWATGHVSDSDGQPLVGALVAVYDDGNHIMDHARTDRNGDYALALPRRALHLYVHHGKGFLSEVFGTLTRFVGSTVGFVANPIRAGVHAVTASQAANFADPLTRGEITAGGAVIDQALFAVSPHPKQPLPSNDRKQPGAMLIKVIAPERNDLVGVAHVYWVENEIFRAAGRVKSTTAAWIDPVQMMQVDTERLSRIKSDYFTFTSARLQPSLVETGQTVRIYATMPIPPTPDVHVVVVARNDRTGEKWEMEPLGDGRFTTRFEIDRHFPPNDQTISLIAYAALEQRPGRRKDAEAAIEHAGFWNSKKAYQYDPLLVVSRNRADLTLTVVVPKRTRH